MRLKDKVAVVTGGAAGIGEAIAAQFAREGAKVVIVDVSDRGSEVASRIQEAGGEVLFLCADISSESACKEIMHKTKEQFGAIHILVNNAGVHMHTENVTTATMEDWDRIMKVNLQGAWFCCKYAIPVMELQGGGSIINMSSTHALRTQPNHFPYQVSKSGIMGMTLGICVDFGSKGIRANNISPGFIQTPMAAQFMRKSPESDQLAKNLLKAHPLGRFGKPEDVAHAAVFLASDDASFISGINLIVDGGRAALQNIN